MAVSPWVNKIDGRCNQSAENEYNVGSDNCHSEKTCNQSEVVAILTSALVNVVLKSAVSSESVPSIDGHSRYLSKASKTRSRYELRDVDG